MLYEVITKSALKHHGQLMDVIIRLAEALGIPDFYPNTTVEMLKTFSLEQILKMIIEMSYYFSSRYKSLLQLSGVPESELEDVITSYSIHYTKLYECHQTPGSADTRGRTPSSSPQATTSGTRSITIMRAWWGP